MTNGLFFIQLQFGTVYWYLKLIPEAYSEPSHTSRMKFFARIFNEYRLLTIFAKRHKPLIIFA